MMMVKQLLDFSAVVLVAASPLGELAPTRQEKIAQLMQPVDECVFKVVAADSRHGKEEITHLIVDSFEKCIDPARKLVDGLDEMHKREGYGHAFFMGPYLDGLTGRVREYLKKMTTTQ